LINVHALIFLSAGQEDFDKLRPLSYHGTDCFIVCFSVANHPSFLNITQRWLPELKQHKQSHIPFILVATKVDLRNQSSLKLISEAEGRALAKKIGAYGYVECSAKTLAGLDEVFNMATDAARRPKEKSKICSIM
jgi:Ras homolog gene family, member A